MSYGSDNPNRHAINLEREIILYVYKSGILYITMYDSGGNNRDAGSYATTAGQWYHVIGRYDGAQLSLWVDGVTTVGTYLNNSAIGSDYSGTQWFWDGLIDEVRIYDRALSAEEILQHYNSGAQQNTSTFVYDGDGNRGKKTEGGETILYVNQYYEKNLTTSEVTTYYYLGDRPVAMRKGTDLRYIHQDHLTGTAVVSDSSGNQVGSMKYYPYGSTRSGSVPTDKKFTGQRLDGTGLYYYGARYYDPAIGHFVSPDKTIPDFDNPQSYNRYSYCINNPLRYNDPTGHWGWEGLVSSVKKTFGKVTNFFRTIFTPAPAPSSATPQPPDPTPAPYGYVREVNIDVDSPFSVWEPPLPKAHGRVEIEGSATWTDDDVRVDINVAIRRNYIAEGEVVGIGAAKIETTGSRDVWFDLQHPEGTYIVPVGYSSVSGGTTIFNVPSQADIALEVGLFAYDRYANFTDPSFSRVEPWSWIVDLRTGDVIRNNNPWR